MTKSVYGIGILLFGATMLIFFSMYIFGMNTDYFNNSLLLNAFLMPAVYLAGAYYSVHIEKKKGVPMGFRDVFGKAFKPMFVGGLLSIITIWFFLNFADPGAKDLLNYQYIERQKTELNKEYVKAKTGLKDEAAKAELEQKYQERLESFSPEMVKDKDMFTLRQFTYYFAAILVFYVILSTFFGSFFRNKPTV